MSHPFFKETPLHFVQPKSGPTGRTVVVLERVEDVAQDDTDYCIHGKVTCHRCGKWCWLGDRTHEAVLSGEVTGICMPCANEIWDRAASEGKPPPPPVANLGDHRRADGPH